ncbi:MAG: hypothetical protein HZB16_11135 [Armatimonadetes bacterium]|nr:hypothetical protein [Armatimonadota bacterium]
MKERLIRLSHWLWQWFLAALRGVWALLGMFYAWLSRQSRLLSTRAAMRAKERERRQRLEAIGGMVFILFKRSLVRNHDLLVECEKVRDIDLELDALLGQADRIRTERRAAAAPSADTSRLAAQTVETDAAADGVTALDPLATQPDRLTDGTGSDTSLIA